MIMDSTADHFVCEARRIDQANLQDPYTELSALLPGITEQHARQPRPAETARNETMLPVHSELGATPIVDNVGAAPLVLSTFQQDGAAVLDAERLRPPPNSNIKNCQDSSLNIDRTALSHNHLIPIGVRSDGIRHQMPLTSAETIPYISGHVDIPPGQSDQASIALANVPLTGCFPGVGQNVPFDSHTADLR